MCYDDITLTLCTTMDPSRVHGTTTLHLFFITADMNRSASLLLDVVMVMPDGDQGNSFQQESERTNSDLESNHQGSKYKRGQEREHVLGVQSLL